MTPALNTMMSRAAMAPFADLDAIVGAGGLVVLAPHPDDESLGCGGLLRATAVAGRRVAVIVVTDGRLSHPASAQVNPETLARLRAAEVRAAVATLHPAIAVIELGYHDCAVPTTQPETAMAVAEIAGAVDAIGATALLTAWQGDPHRDHVATADLARRTLALRPDLRLWSYPIWGRFAPAEPAAPRRIVRFDTTPHRAAKTAAIACHRTQMTRIIDDDPQGFLMAAAMQAHFIAHPEVFLADQ